MVPSNNNTLDDQIIKASYAFAIAGKDEKYVIDESFAITEHSNSSERSAADRRIVECTCKLLERSLNDTTSRLDNDTINRLCSGMNAFVTLHAEAFKYFETHFLTSFFLPLLEEKTQFTQQFDLVGRCMSFHKEIGEIVSGKSKKNQNQQLTCLYDELRELYITQKVINLLFKRIVVVSELFKISVESCKECMNIGCKEMALILRLSHLAVGYCIDEKSTKAAVQELIDMNLSKAELNSILGPLFTRIKGQAIANLASQYAYEMNEYMQVVFEEPKESLPKAKMLLFLMSIDNYFTGVKLGDDLSSQLESREFLGKKIQFLVDMAQEIQKQLIKNKSKDLELYGKIEDKVTNIIKTDNKNLKERKRLQDAHSHMELAQISGNKKAKKVSIAFTAYRDLFTEVSFTDKKITTKADTIIKIAKSEITRARKVALEQSFKAISLNENKEQKPVAIQLDIVEEMASKPSLLPECDSITQVQQTILYHPRVTRWWSGDHENNPFVHDPNYNQKHYSQEAASWIFAEHNFALVIDQWLHAEGIVHGNHLSLIGEISMNGKTKQGIFTYAFDNNNVCYHRCFTSKTTDEILMKYAEKGFYDLNYPIYEVDLLKETPLVSLTEDGSSITDISQYVFTVDDPKNGATIRICRLK